MEKDLDLSSKLIRLWSVAITNHRQPVGDKAWKTMEQLTNKQTVMAISFMSGFMMAGGCIEKTAQQMKDLVPELKEE